jgi:hypothetical protein
MMKMMKERIKRANGRRGRPADRGWVETAGSYIPPQNIVLPKTKNNSRGAAKTPRGER